MNGVIGWEIETLRSYQRDTYRTSTVVAAGDKLFRHLRREFVQQLVNKMERARQIRAPIAAVWLDSHGRLGNAQVIAYMAPQSFDPKRPLITRIAVNCYRVLVSRGFLNRLGCAWNFFPNGGVERPRLELSTTPEELLDFVPWVANLADHHDRGVPLEEPPHPCHFRGVEMREANYGWTRAAWQEAEAYEDPRDAMRERARRLGQMPDGVA